jgi:hypothetical protein
MDRKKRYEIETARYAYGSVEQALADLFGADAATKTGALRGRLKHLQRLGLPGIEAGKGARISYTKSQVAQWVYALLMSEAGIDPTVSVDLIKKYWTAYIERWTERATDDEARNGNPVFLTLRPRLMSGDWSKRKPSPDTLPFIGWFRRYDYHLKDAAGRPIRRENIRGTLDDLEDEWFCIRNLTDALVKIETALKGKEEK